MEQKGVIKFLIIIIKFYNKAHLKNLSNKIHFNGGLALEKLIKE